MRRWFIALLALLVTAQLSWAGAALCCVEEVSQQATALLSGDVPHSTAQGDAHAGCEVGHCHCHHTGCATPLDEAALPAPAQRLAPEPTRAVRLQSHIPAGLERPNWLRA